MVEPQQNHQLIQNKLKCNVQEAEETSEIIKDIKMAYNIDWVFPRLMYPSKFWYFASTIAIAAVGLFSKILLVFFNTTKVYNEERLIEAVSKRPPGKSLLTISNHHSCFDDPGLWGILPLQHCCARARARWSLAAHDICFTNKYHSLFFMAGKCIPVVRGAGVYQNAIEVCLQKLTNGEWVHIFPEGKVNMTREFMRLKWGIGRLIYDSPRLPIVLPIWHEGMHDVLPNVEPYVPKWGKKVTVNIGRPLDLNDMIKDMRLRGVPEPEARKIITDRIQDELQKLRVETEELHRA